MKISCKMCGGNIKFVPSIQKVCCEHCGNIFLPEEIQYDDNVYDEGEKYTCSSCGVELVSFDKTGIVNCLYCGGKEFVKGKFNNEYVLKGIFPFKVDRDEFIKCYEDYFNSIENVNQNFLDKVKQANVKSMYLPYSFANNFFRKQYSKEFNEILEEIVPFDFRGLKKLNPIYLDNSLAEIIKTKKEENDIKTDDTTFYWVPIWYAEIEYKYIKYYIVMNGQTMEIAGYCNSSCLGEQYADKIVINKKYRKKNNGESKLLSRLLLSVLVFMLIFNYLIMLEAGMFIVTMYYSVILIFVYISIDTFNNPRVKIGKDICYIIPYEKGKFHLRPNINKYRNVKKYESEF